MDVAVAGVKDLELIPVFVSKTLLFKGQKGSVVVDWQTDKDLLRATGSRSYIKIVGPVHVELGGLADPKHVYNVGFVHHDRDNSSVPTYVESVTRHQGSLLLKASAAIARLEGTVGYSLNVTEIIEPTPAVGKSPRLVAFFHSTGTDSTSELRANVKFNVQVSGGKTPDFD